MAKNPHAVALGLLGGPEGARARFMALSAEERSAIAQKAAKARWQKASLAEAPRDTFVTIRLDASESAALDALATAQGRSRSDVLRLALHSLGPAPKRRKVARAKARTRARG